MKRTVGYALAGLALALGAPVGWLAIEVVGRGLSPQAAAARDPLLYAYLCFATALVFAAFGAALGHREDVIDARDRTLETMARTDVLTGLANVRAFREALSREVARAGRSHAPLGLVMMDLDHFKRVNDTFGHAAGDEVLAHTARVLSSAVREADLVARVGGEEFAILCPGADASECAAVAERARQAIEAQQVLLEGKRVPITASFGVANLRAGADALLASADAALYEAKRAGRNRVLTSAA